jgi:hypothetical protein
VIHIEVKKCEKIQQAILVTIIVVNFGLMPTVQYAESLIGVSFIKRHIIVVISILIYCIIGFIYNFNKLRVRVRIELFTFITCILLQLVAMPWAIRYGDKGLSVYISVILNTFISSWLMFLIGSNFHKLKEIIIKPKTKLLMNILFLAFFGLIIYGVTLNPYGEFQIYYGKIKIDYLFIGDTFAIYTFLILYVNKNRLYKFIITIVGVLTLYLISSRLSFVIFIVVIFINIGIGLINRIDIFNRGIKKKRMLYSIGLLICFLLVIMIFTHKLGKMEISIDKLYNNRIFGGLTDIKHDESYVSRQELFTLGINTLRKNIILGKFMYEVDVMGITGGYIHNIFSYLVEYGPIFFSLFIVCLLKKSWQFFMLYKKTKLKDSYDVLKISIFIFTLMSIILGRSYIYAYIWLPIGMIKIINCKEVKSYNRLKIYEFNL